MNTMTGHCLKYETSPAGLIGIRSAVAGRIEINRLQPSARSLRLINFLLILRFTGLILSKILKSPRQPIAAR
jgi:hypothetical protein